MKTKALISFAVKPLSQVVGMRHMETSSRIVRDYFTTKINQRTNGPENAHLKPDPGVLSHHEMTLTLNTHTPLLNS